MGDVLLYAVLIVAGLALAFLYKKLLPPKNENVLILPFLVPIAIFAVDQGWISELEAAGVKLAFAAPVEDTIADDPLDLVIPAQQRQMVELVGVGPLADYFAFDDVLVFEGEKSRIPFVWYDYELASELSDSIEFLADHFRINPGPEYIVFGPSFEEMGCYISHSIAIGYVSDPELDVVPPFNQLLLDLSISNDPRRVLEESPLCVEPLTLDTNNLEALEIMTRRNESMALIIDDQGAYAGYVTAADIVAAIAKNN